MKSLNRARRGEEEEDQREYRENSGRIKRARGRVCMRQCTERPSERKAGGGRKTLKEMGSRGRETECVLNEKKKGWHHRQKKP